MAGTIWSWVMRVGFVIIALFAGIWLFTNVFTPIGTWAWSNTLGRGGQEVVQKPVATPMPRVEVTAVSTAVPAPAAARQPAAASGPCRAVHDYGLDLKPEVATSMLYIRVQFWTDGQPERETFLPASAAPGGRFLLTVPLRGHVWEFDGICTDADMKADVDGSIARRKLGGANTAGYVEWQATGLFRPAVSPN